LAPRLDQYKYNEMPIDTDVYRIQSLAKMIKPRANTINIPTVPQLTTSRKMSEENSGFIQNNILKLKDHYRKVQSKKAKIQKTDTRLPLERFEQEMIKQFDFKNLNEKA